jgi:hypothetical protein
MTITVRIPNFRLPSRLVSWMRDNCIRERVHSAEKVFFDTRLSVETRSWGLSEYAKLVGELPPELEDILIQRPESCLAYASVLCKRTPMKVMDACASNPSVLVRFVSKIGGRLPPHLEDKITTPEDYSSYISETRVRVPEMEQRIMFSAPPSDAVAATALKIMEVFTPFGYGKPKDDSCIHDPELKRLILHSPKAVEAYMDFLGRRGMRIGPEFYGVFEGKGAMMLKLANHLQQRLPEELERTWEDPKTLVAYTMKFVKKRLPEYLESVLIGDQQAACQYAFEVVRGFSSPRLSDSLHGFMLMKSFETPDDPDIKRYVAECERIAGNN